MGNNCASNTLFINTPSQQTAGQCAQGTCAGLTTPVCCNKPIGKRPCREKVREQLRDLALLRLGAPVIKIELDEQQVQAAIDMALLEFEEYAGREYFTYYVFNSQPGKSVYTMPPDVGFIRQVYYREQPNVTFNAADVGGVLPVEYYYPGGAYSSIQGGLMDPNTPIYGRAGEWVLYKQYEQMYNRLASQLGGWEWIDGYCNIKLYPTPCRCNAVIVQYLQVQPDFKRVTTAMIEGVYYHMMEILGRVRGKWTTIPGPMGGMQLDGPALLAEAKEGLEKWRTDLIYKWGDGPQGSIFLD
jgi:hypothetical protein